MDARIRILTDIFLARHHPIPHDELQLSGSNYFSVVAWAYINIQTMAKQTNTIEPYFITFKWTSWHVFGYCRDRNGFRLFKLNRLWRHGVLDEVFTPREIPSEEFDLDDYFTDENRITILFDKSLEYRLAEECGPDCYQVI